MTKTTHEYAQMLLEQGIRWDIAAGAQALFLSVPQLGEQLENPLTPQKKKNAVIDETFPPEIRDFLKLLCRNNAIRLYGEIVEAYETLLEKRKSSIPVTLRCVEEPTEEQLVGLTKFILKNVGGHGFELETIVDPSLGSGFILTIGGKEYNWSTAGRLAQLQEELDRAEDVVFDRNSVALLTKQIEAFELSIEGKEVGSVISVGDGIASLRGIDHAAYGEIVVFDSGVKGIIQNVRETTLDCILFGNDTEVREGSRVVRTGKSAGVSVSDDILGRVVNAMGEPIDGGPAIQGHDYRPIEKIAPGVITREEVSVPLQTGILAIDAMFPIGRGQRELIIGDRQTGKTTIATDTILNQKGKDVICIYVAIGQKRSTVSSIVEQLKKGGAMSYSIVVAATASEPSPLQYIAPYAGCAMGEYFMQKGQHVLIIYDDLSKHAVAYRALSLLIRRPPGREAYPGDVFYLHSRLLERAAKLSDEKGGGSLTALPIIETQAGDVSAYIPTNVISITDGQIFLETELFHSGIMPAVNPGISVSRVGGNAQIKAMKKVAGTLKLVYSQYRELQSFAQFGSDLDQDTKDRLEQGARIVEMLKQKNGAPVPVEKQVAIIYAVTKNYLSDVRVDEVGTYEQDLYSFLDRDPDGLAAMNAIRATGAWNDEIEGHLKAAVEAFTKEFLAAR